MTVSKRFRLLPPSHEEAHLAEQINRKLPTHARVTACRSITTDADGDEVLRYGMIYQYNSARNPVWREYPFFDDEETIRDINLWINSMRYAQAQTWEIARDDGKNPWRA